MFAKLKSLFRKVKAWFRGLFKEETKSSNITSTEITDHDTRLIRISKEMNRLKDDLEDYLELNNRYQDTLKREAIELLQRQEYVAAQREEAQMLVARIK